MSKKQLLTEAEIRRFMKLANLQPLAGNVISEGGGSIPQDPRHPETVRPEDEKRLAEETPMGDMPEAMPSDATGGGEEEAMGGEEGGMEVEVGGEAEPEKKEAFEAAVKALADAMGIEVELESQEEAGEEAGEEMHDLEASGEEGAEEEESDEEEGELEETETQTLSEDELVETVLARVTARLVAEAKKKKMSAKDKMKLKAKKKKEESKKEESKKEESIKEESKKKVEEATEAKGGGPLLKQGKNKYDPWKGHADMAYAKGKEGKGGHQMENLPAKAEHSVTHGGKNLATLGGNNKKV